MENEVATKTPDNGDEFISESEVRVSPRGRKAVYDAKLIEALRSIPAGKVARLSGSIGSVAKSERPKVSAVIRKHWRVAKPGTECRVDFDPETGVPQVRQK
jgi:hypothetical protein